MATDNSVSELLDLAAKCFETGNIAEARNRYQRILEAEPEQVEALYRLGLLDCREGRFDAGVQRMGRAVALAPNYSEALYNLGVACMDNGDAQGAIVAYRRATAVAPGFALAWYNLGLALNGQRSYGEAIEAFRSAIALKPDYPEAHCNLGVALEQQGMPQAAIAAYRQAAALNPSLPEAHFNLGRTLQAMPGCLDEAIGCFRQAVLQRPTFAAAWCHLGDALTRKGQPDEIIFAFRQALALQPNHAEAHFNLGVALWQKGQIEEAIAAYRKAIALKPAFAGACCRLASALKDQGDLRAAANMYRRAIELRPDDIDSLYHLGSLFTELGELDESIDAYRGVIALCPGYPQALNNLAIALKSAGQLSEAIATYREAIAINPDYVDAHSNLLMTLHYSVESTPLSLREAHKRWDDQHARPLRNLAAGYVNSREKGRRLRIGYVSGDFWDHAAARFILPLLSNHNRDACQIFCYSNSSKADGVTEKLKKHTDCWRTVVGLTDEQAAQMIGDDRIDILVDLSMHTQGNRLLIFARQPAPVQATWLGYAGTTGMTAVGWRLTDPYLDPTDAELSDYVERSIRLPTCFWCYDPIHPTGHVNPLRAVETGQITFGCFNNFAKVSVPTQELWGRLMAEVPGSRLILHCQPGSHRNELLDRFVSCGVASDRIEFVGRLPLLDYMARYRHVDIALDPFPFSGGTTSCDALWMGVPIVTLRGKTAVGRGGASILTTVGLRDWVADTPEQYLQIALEKAADIPALALLRSELRERMRQSPLMDGPRFAAGVESAYQQMWHAWCDSNVTTIRSDNH
jgi:predicted O-linked N-acetylglucosamine transferase (SPINDLY family)